jgi:DNA polymerase type B, organellar and viral
MLFIDIYNAYSGILISEVEDKLINNNYFIRRIGNVSLSILNGEIVKIESIKKLASIKFTPKSLKGESNPFIGSWDVEAFEDKDGYAKVYALGFATLDKNVKMYYLENGVTSEQLVLKCIDDMLVNQYNGYVFYTHNFGRYDARFLLKILKEENIRRGYEHYILKELNKGGKPIKLTIKVKRVLSDRKPSKIGARRDPGFNTISIVDSLNLLNQSLDKLCDSFNVEVTKGKFPHSFVRRNTLNYVGDTPSYDY